MKCREFIKIHHDIVRQVSFISSINSFISSASESIASKSTFSPSVIIGSLGAQESQIVIRMNGVSGTWWNLQFTGKKLLHSFLATNTIQGTTCFAFDESSKTLATGEPHSMVDFTRWKTFLALLRFWGLSKKKGSKEELFFWPSSISRQRNFRLIKFLAFSSRKNPHCLDLFRAPFLPRSRRIPLSWRQKLSKISSLIINKIRFYLWCYVVVLPSNRWTRLHHTTVGYNYAKSTESHLIRTFSRHHSHFPARRQC